MKSAWLVKQEPSAYSWEQFCKEGKTAWTGVRNFQARNYLRAMKKGDDVLFYHSVTGKCVVGLARVLRTAFPDPTADNGDWVCVDLEPVNSLPKPVSLETIKETPGLEEIALIRQSRLSVMPLTPKEFTNVLRLGGLSKGKSGPQAARKGKQK